MKERIFGQYKGRAPRAFRNIWQRFQFVFYGNAEVKSSLERIWNDEITINSYDFECIAPAELLRFGCINTD